MSDPRPPKSGRTVGCSLHLVDIFCFLGALYQHPEAGVENVIEIIERLSYEIHTRTGIPYAHILAAVHLVARGERLDGGDPDPRLGPYAGSGLDLSHVARPLHELDNDGTTARLWRNLCRTWPVIPRFVRRMLTEEKEEGAGTKPPLPPSDGTIERKTIWLKGKKCRLTHGLRDLLNYLLSNQGVEEERVIRDFAMSGQSHLQSRLTVLRQRLNKELNGSGWQLEIKTEGSEIYWTWSGD